MATEEKKFEEQEVQKDVNAEQPAETNEEQKELTPEEKIAEQEKQLAAQKDSYLRLMADFDNFRKNTLKDKQNLLKYGGEDVLKKLLPVIDDFERAMAAMKESDDVSAIKEGIELIYQKFQKYLTDNGLSVIPAEAGETFNEEIHDAMTLFPAPTPDLKGKVVDCVAKGYKLNDKVIRFAKVVVGQ